MIRDNNLPRQQVNGICGAYFDLLGARANELWRKENYDECAFPDVAEALLTEASTSMRVTFWDTLKLAFLGPLQRQLDIEAAFGQPPFTVYWQEEFRIELLYWVEGVPGVHQHGFSGAFQVLHGSSLHLEWNFTVRERLGSRLLVGKQSPRRAELLRKGDVRSIRAGNSFIHSTYHLDRPSVSLVVRTNQEQEHIPQYSYLYPTIAFVPHDIGAPLKRRTQLLRMLAQSGRTGELMDIMLHFLEVADVFSVFTCVSSAYHLLKSEVDRNRILVAAARRYPVLIEALIPALRISERHNQIIALRRKITNPDLQFFLALLLNVFGKDSILALIKARYPAANPIDRIVGWVHELEAQSLFSLDSGLSVQTLKIILTSGLPLDDKQGLVPAQTQASPCDVNVAATVEKLQTHWLLAPLFMASV